MKKVLALLFLFLPFSAQAAPGDCATTKSPNPNGWIDVVNLPAIQSHGDLDCIERNKIPLKSTAMALRAISVVDGYTIFFMGGRSTPIAVVGTNYAEHQPLLEGDYLYRGLQTFQKDNGFTVDLPVIERK